MSKETNETQEMNQGQAVNVLIQAARIAQQKGAFTLEDAEMVSKAIKVFVPPTEAEGNDPVENTDTPTEPVIQAVK
tara:strand:+ start:285 stop:512 length:228 start_codon:yes stop_codon:yes gene_type:complete